MAQLDDWYLMAKRLIGSALCAALLVAAAGATAQQIHIDPGDCDAGVRLTAKGVRLSEVLKRLSETLGFQLQYEGTSDPVINVDVSRQAPELVARLSPAESMMVTQAVDPRCPRHYRIVKVWVLPKAKENISPPAATHGQAAQVQPTAQYQPSQLDKMSLKAKEMYDAYVKTHGVPPPSPEEEAAN